MPLSDFRNRPTCFPTEIDTNLFSLEFCFLPLFSPSTTNSITIYWRLVNPRNGKNDISTQPTPNSRNDKKGISSGKSSLMELKDFFLSIPTAVGGPEEGKLEAIWAGLIIHSNLKNDGEMMMTTQSKHFSSVSSSIHSILRGGEKTLGIFFLAHTPTFSR